MKNGRRGEIYVLHCLITDMKYVGKALKTTAEKRWDDHINCALGNRQPSVLLHKAIRKYGVAAFTAEVVEECAASRLNAAERRWIKKLGTLVPGGYNLTVGGEGSYGFKHKLASKIKMRASALRVWENKEHREHMSEVHKGQEFSEERRSKISKRSKGHAVSAKTRASLSATHKALFEKDPNRAAHLKSGLHRTPHTVEAKAKMSIAQQRRWAKDYAGMYDAVRGGWSGKTEKEKAAWRKKCSASVKAAWRTKTAEERSAIVRRCWVVRRRRNALLKKAA